MRWLLFSTLFWMPSGLLFASVSISEIAWMGSGESANHEWIELYNNTEEAVVVDAWTLSDGVNLTIALTGTIPARAYVVLERNRSDGGSVIGTPFLNYAGALVNTGATLTLRRDDDSIVDQVAGGENWQNIGGDNVTKNTAQYTNNGWITGVPTPGRANTTVASTPSPVVTTSNLTSATARKTTTATTVTPKLSPPPAPEALSLRLNLPALIYEGQPVTFIVTPQGSGPTIRNSLVYEWNFGDLNTSTSKNPTHTYEYPGTYNVVVRASFADFTALARQEVTVLPLTVSLSHTVKGDIMLHNDALYEMDVSEYYLTGSKTKIIPPRTYISPRETITIPWQMVADTAFPVVVLFGREKELITKTGVGLTTSNDTFEVIPSAPTQTHVQARTPTSVPTTLVAENEQVKQAEESASSLFGFVPLIAQAESGDAIDSDLKNNNDEVAVLRMGVPIVGEGEVQTPVPPVPTSPLSTWAYVVLTLVLFGVVASIIVRPVHQNGVLVTEKNK